jgi:hypothetical protein
MRDATSALHYPPSRTASFWSRISIESSIPFLSFQASFLCRNLLAPPSGGYPSPSSFHLNSRRFNGFAHVLSEFQHAFLSRCITIAAPAATSSRRYALASPVSAHNRRRSPHLVSPASNHSGHATSRRSNFIIKLSTLTNFIEGAISRRNDSFAAFG